MSVKVLVNYSYVKEIDVSYVSFGLDDVIYFENNLIMSLSLHIITNKCNDVYVMWDNKSYPGCLDDCFMVCCIS
jgi:hypothetical protein